MMYRYSDRILKIQLIDNIDFKAFKASIEHSNHQLVMFRNESGRFIVFFDHPPKELFKWSENFRIIKGSTYLYCDGKPVTASNYNSLNWEEMTNTSSFNSKI